MAFNPPIRNVAFETYIMLEDANIAGSFKVNPTIAAGDFKVSKDGGAFANFTTLPVVTPSGGRAVKLELSSSEMDADNVAIQCVDQTAPKEWADLGFTIITVAP